jgi:hypothetical protein
MPVPLRASPYSFTRGSTPDGCIGTPVVLAGAVSLTASLFATVGLTLARAGRGMAVYSYCVISFAAYVLRSSYRNMDIAAGF